MLPPRYTPLLAAIGSILLCSNLNALILYSGDNSANQTAPDAARQEIFDSVGRIAGADRGSVVHIRGKYLLTADHVNTNTNLVSFDGSTNWEIDTAFAPIQIGTTDMKLLKLVDDPGIPATQLYTQTNLGTVTLVGWGKGAGSNSGTEPERTWSWGNNSTMAKRWGSNDLDGFLIQPSGPDYSYSYWALQTTLNSAAGDNEAGLALFDSGSGLFINDGGTWKLAGIATVVQQNGSSRFASDGHINRFVAIPFYSQDIEDEIPDLTDYSGWLVDHSLTGDDAAATADTDHDGLPQLLEFAFGANPNRSDPEKLPQATLVTDNESDYLGLPEKVLNPVKMYVCVRKCFAQVHGFC